MGRFKAMAAALVETPAPLTVVSSRQVEASPAPARLRKLTRRTIPDHDRYQALRQISIRTPHGPHRRESIEQAALVWCHTKRRHCSAHVDAKHARIVARYLDAEGRVHQCVDPERALTRERVDYYLEHQLSCSDRSKKSYRHVLYQAGAVLYPREFPAPYTPITPRGKATPAAAGEETSLLYAQARNLPEWLAQQLVLILDLTTAAGLSAGEIRALTGTDVEVLRLTPGREIIMVTIRRRGRVDRRVPVVCPVRGQRILDRADEVGKAPLLPLNADGQVERNAVNRVSERMKARGMRGFSVAALRNRWLMDLATTPGIPTVALMQQLAGIGDLRSWRICVLKCRHMRSRSWRSFCSALTRVV